ncbi:MAG TPA: winged helix DNA-binding domain-containing protein, partial [Candidatus Sulfomarinibacteraceae bacterium]|nr:winged helix DNA-binding domain-containing protein [Candidatus Sulfomarinibacteraceae bacterium]
RRLTVNHVRAALEKDRSIIRTWLMRGTLHLVTTEDAAWLLPLLGPLFVPKGARRRKQLGLVEAVWKRAAPAIRDILGQHGPLTRPALAQRLAKRDIPTEGQAIAHLVARAAMEGLICFGPDTADGEHTYVLLEAWVDVELAAPDEIDEAQAYAGLVRRYVQAYGPVGPRDFASWSGLGLRATRAAFERLNAELLTVEAGGETLHLLPAQREWLDAAPRDGPVVRLLPAFDAYLLGYRNRDLIVAQPYARRVHPGGGMIRATVLLDGQAAGTWRWQQERQGRTLVVHPFRPLDRDVIDALEREAAAMGEYMALQATAGLRLESEAS